MLCSASIQIMGLAAFGIRDYHLSLLFLYSRTLYTMRPDAGTLQIKLMYDPTFQTNIFDTCCSEDVPVPGGCFEFYSRRPIDICTDYAPPCCCGRFENNLSDKSTTALIPFQSMIYWYPTNSILTEVCPIQLLGYHYCL